MMLGARTDDYFPLFIHKFNNNCSEFARANRRSFNKSFDISTEINDDAAKKSTVAIRIQNTPTLRLVRNVSLTRLDSVVIVGSVIALFFGSSVLGLAEIIYIWLIRKF